MEKAKHYGFAVTQNSLASIIRQQTIVCVVDNVRAWDVTEYPSLMFLNFYILKYLTTIR